MFQTFKTGVAIIVVCLLTPMAAEAQNLADRDAKEVADYVLTDATLSKYRSTSLSTYAVNGHRIVSFESSQIGGLTMIRIVNVR